MKYMRISFYCLSDMQFFFCSPDMCKTVHGRRESFVLKIFAKSGTQSPYLARHACNSKIISVKKWKNTYPNSYGLSCLWHLFALPLERSHDKGSLCCCFFNFSLIFLLWENHPYMHCCIFFIISYTVFMIPNLWSHGYYHISECSYNLKFILVISRTGVFFGC